MWTLKSGLTNRNQTHFIITHSSYVPPLYFHLNPEATSDFQQEHACVFVGWIMRRDSVHLHQGHASFSSRGDDELSLFASLHSLSLFGPWNWRKNHIFSSDLCFTLYNVCVYMNVFQIVTSGLISSLHFTAAAEMIDHSQHLMQEWPRCWPDVSNVT